MKRNLPVVIAVFLVLLSLYTVVFAQGTIPSFNGAYLPFIVNSVPTSTPMPLPTRILDVAPGDIKPPDLITWSFSATSIDVSKSDQTITVTARVVDDLSGLYGGGFAASFFGPHGQHTSVAFVYPFHLISGTVLDGNYRSWMTLPRYSATGTWNIDHLILEDRVGNKHDLSHDDVSALGLPTSFTVKN